MEIKAQFSLDKLQHNKENDLHLVVSLTAPKIDWQKPRAPICIIPVVDCSGSMQGDKMEYAKQSALKLIDHLQPGDYMGIIGFSDNAFVVSKPVEVTQAQKDMLKAKVGELKALQSTNFAGGMLAGLEQGNKMDLPDGTNVRIIMFTDGQANVGVATKKDDIVKLLKEAMKNCSVSAFGYGADANQDMLTELSKTGNGNYAFIKRPEDALTAFGKELGGLLSTYATNIQVELAPHNGHRITQALSDVDVEEDGNKAKLKLSDILAEETRHLVFAIKTSEQKQALPRDVNVFDIKLTYDTFDEKGKKHSKTEEIKAKLRFVKDGEEQKKPTKAVDEIVALAQLANAQIEAEKHANAGDFQGAMVVMTNQALNFEGRGLMNFADASSSVGKKMETHTVYAASAGYRSSVSRGARRAYAVSSYDTGAAADLASLNLCMSNSSQDQFSTAFAGDAAAGVVLDSVAAPVVSSSAPVVIQPIGAAGQPSVAGSIVVPPAKEEKKDEKDKGSYAKSKSKRW